MTFLHPPSSQGPSPPILYLKYQDLSLRPQDLHIWLFATPLKENVYSPNAVLLRGRNEWMKLLRGIQGIFLLKSTLPTSIHGPPPRKEQLKSFYFIFQPKALSINGISPLAYSGYFLSLSPREQLLLQKIHVFVCIVSVYVYMYFPKEGLTWRTEDKVTVIVCPSGPGILGLQISSFSTQTHVGLPRYWPYDPLLTVKSGKDTTIYWRPDRSIS